MTFLKPEPKPFTWKSILKSAEFMRLAFIIFLAAVVIVFMVVLVARWDELVPTSVDKTPGTEEATYRMPESASLPLSEVTTITPVSPPVTPTPPALVPKFFEGRLDNVKDYTPAKQDEAFNYLLNYVMKISPEEISKRVNSNIKFQDLMEHPKKYRGQLVRLKGQLVISPQPYNLATNPAGLEIYYAGWLGDADKGEMCHFILTDRPIKYVGINDRQGWADMVWVEGAFLKLEKYERDPRVGGYQVAPFLMGRRMDKVPVSLKGIATLQFVLAGLIVLALMGIVIGIVIGTRKDKAYQTSRMAKWQKRIKTNSTSPTEKPEP